MLLLQGEESLEVRLPSAKGQGRKTPTKTPTTAASVSEVNRPEEVAIVEEDHKR